LAHADIGAGMPLGAALAHEDVAGENLLAAELLHAEALGLRIAPVARRTASLLVCHRSAPSVLLFVRLGGGLLRRSLAGGLLPGGFGLGFRLGRLLRLRRLGRLGSGCRLGLGLLGLRRRLRPSG